MCEMLNCRTPYLLPTLCLLCVFRYASSSTGPSDKLVDTLEKYYETGSDTNPSDIRDQFRLIDQEPILMDTLWKYIESESSRLDELEKFRNVLVENTEQYEAHDDDLAHNPLAVYVIVRHLTVDLDDVLHQKLERNSYDNIVPRILSGKKLHLPDENDLYHQIRDLVLLQRLYNFTVRDIMNGHLTPDTADGTSLTTEDCFYIGKTSAEKYDHETAIKWLRECEDEFNNEVRNEAYEILMSSALFVGDFSLGKEMVNYKLHQNPNNRVLCDMRIQLNNKIGNWDDHHDRDQYESFKTCAGDYDENLAFKNLKCRYNHHNSPFLTIAPLKEEMLSFLPKVSVFRDAVYDSEIELLKTEAYDLFGPATVITPDTETGRSVDLDYRPSRTTFLDNTQAKYIVLWNRLQDMSSLSLKHSEHFQMLHYAPGGFYRVHSDYHPSLPDLDIKGNRMATALLYLNSVTAGGHTVFPRLGLKVQPIKGSVLFWINMEANGSEELFVRHAACPVMYGEKLACTQWFRTKGQDHWIAEPEDDEKASYSTIQNIMCREREM